MTGTKVEKVCRKYIEDLRGYGYEARRQDVGGGRLEHAVWMCEETIKLARTGRIEKAMRWLGFIQGVLFCMGMFTIDQMKNHNRPTKEDIRGEYSTHTLLREVACAACGDLDGCHKWRELEEAL